MIKLDSGSGAGMTMGGTDIDSYGNTGDTIITRPIGTSWDIGADELITKIYRSVGVGTTAAIISGTSPAISLTISGNIGTFATWPTSADFGVGDVIRYDSDNNGSLDSTAFISAIDSTAKTATLQNPTGASSAATSAPDYDWKLYRAHTSLSDWEAGTANAGIGVTFPGGNRDIASNSEQWNVACYANSGTAPDTTTVTVSGWTTAKQNYIKIYTPTSTSEVTTSQRHQGKWDANKYNLNVSSGIAIDTYSKNIRYDGLQIRSGNNNAIQIGYNITTDKELYISNNIINSYNTAIRENSALIGTGYIYNNIIYGMTADWNCASDLGGSSSTSSFLYNNTIYTSSPNIMGICGSVRVTAKNNLVKTTSSSFYSATSFNTSSDYNASGDSTSTGGAHDKTSQTFSFIDLGNYDFHLPLSDTVAKESGTDLSQDLYLPIANDIDSQSRPIYGTGFLPDIGADECAVAIYRSLAPSATSAVATNAQGGSLSISGNTATFGTAPGSTIGVGDAIQYDSDNNGSIDSIAFISGRTSSTIYTVQDRVGGTPASTSATDYDWSIYRAYTSINNAISYYGGHGTENSGLNDNVEHFDIDWSGSSSRGKDIYTYNQQWNFATYANGTTGEASGASIMGWTTYPTNYIKLYAPFLTTEVGTSQRHQGKWDGSKYKLDLAAYQGIYIDEQYIWIDGVQIKLTSNSGNYPIGIAVATNNKYSDVKISNNIVQGEIGASSHAATGIRTGLYTSSANVKIWNNIIYGWKNSMDNDPGIDSNSYNSAVTTQIYNNTVYDCETGINSNSTTKIAKNNIVQNCTDGYSGTFNSSSDFNISDVNTSDAPNATFSDDYVNVVFSDETNKDFHLSSSDIFAKNKGTDLFTDTYLPITADIDGHNRPTGTNIVDIGADEGATAIYYSVGQSTSTDFKVASNISVSGYTATFTTAQTGNIGVGDIVTYTGGSCNITGKTSTSIWSCQNVTGGTAPQVTGVAVTSIKRAFASLEGAVDAAQGTGAHDSSHLNTTNLYTNNYQLNIPCYLDSGTQPDTTAVTIQSWTTAVPNYIKVYTPNNTTTEANQSQRHQGKWDTTKYRLEIASYLNLISYANYIKIEGLQIKDNSPNANNSTAIGSSPTGDSSVYISSNIVWGNATQPNSAYYGISLAQKTGNTSFVWNNIVYGFNYNNGGQGISLSGWNTPKQSAYVYNNTVYGCYYGIVTSDDSGSIVAKNNISYNNSIDFSANPYFSSSSTNNLSKDASAPAYNTYYIGKTVTFADVSRYDYHLGIGDTAAQNFGTSLSSDTNFAFTTDIDGNTRNIDSRGWDIGADEAATPIYYSVGQDGTTDRKVTSTITINSSGLASFSAPQTGNIGVGDVIDYDSDNKKAYIVSKVDQSNWYVQTKTGALPTTVTDVTVNSIKRVFTALSTGVTTASGAALLNTTDLYTNNYQLNFPCYYDNAADTAVSISGYTTYPTNYLKIYTPYNTSTEVNNSQRHSGKWDDSKYRLESTAAMYAFENYIKYFVADGLQIKETYTANSVGARAMLLRQSGTTFIKISNNVIALNVTGSGYAKGIDIFDGSNSLVWNNVVYGLPGSIGNGIDIDNCTTANYVYNNTAYNVKYGLSANCGSGVLKNNIAYNNTTDYYGGFSSASTNNLSKDASAPPYNTYYINKTVNFVDQDNYDLHLAQNDTSARNLGADLSADANLSIATDIDDNSRPTLGAFDIGADEGATYIYYSVGQNTSDHKTGSPTITLSGYSATLSVGQTAPNMGVGDKITYTGGSCYITRKTSDDKMHWNCQNATGGTAPQVSGASVTSIAHAFDSLGGTNGALKASSTGAKDSSHLNTSDLYSGNYILNIPCYYDTGADTAAVSVGGWTAAGNNYIKIYTPTNTITEANASQRHQGKWDDAKYKLEKTDVIPLGLNITDVRVEGIQVKLTGTTSGARRAISATNISGKGNIYINNNIIRGSFSGSASDAAGINFYSVLSNVPVSPTFYIYNNLIYDFSFSGMADGDAYGIAGNPVAYIYNNTIINTYEGIHGYGSSITYIKNNISQSCIESYDGTFTSSSANNIAGSSPQYGAFGMTADSGTTTSSASNKLIQSGKHFTQTVKIGMIVKDSGSNYSYVTAVDSETQLSLNDNIMSSSETYTIYTNRYGTVSFANSTENNFHLSLSDTLAKNQGIKLASYSDDNNLNFQTDIDGNQRTGGWSIGADDGPFAEVQESKSLDMNESLNNGLVMYQSFDGDDINIGSTVVYDRSGNGNNGAISGAVPVAGKRGQGLNFNGSNNYVGIGTTNGWSNSTGTMSAWIKPNFAYDVASNKAIINMYSNDVNRWSLYYNATLDGWQFYHIGGGHEDSVRSDVQTFAVGTWIHVLVTWDSGGTNMFINSVYKNNNPTTLALTPAPMRIGMDQYGGGGSYFNGVIDEVRIYNRVLSTGEIGQTYRMGQDTINASQAGKDTNGLVGHWTFDGANITAGTTIDSSVQNKNGTIFGATKTLGKLGQALNFVNGHTDYVDCGNNSITGTNPFTLSAWIKTNSVNRYSGAIAIGSSSGGRSAYIGTVASAQIGSSNSLGGGFYGRNYGSGITTTKEWVYVAMTFAGGTNGAAIIYINGENKVSENYTPNIDSTYTRLGRICSDTTYDFDGSVDDARIYNRALTDQEIKDLYNLGHAVVKK
jgi:hypothetical protein